MSRNSINPKVYEGDNWYSDHEHKWENVTEMFREQYESGESGNPDLDMMSWLPLIRCKVCYKWRRTWPKSNEKWLRKHYGKGYRELFVYD